MFSYWRWVLSVCGLWAVIWEAQYSTIIDSRVTAMQYPPVRVPNAAPGRTIHLPRRVMSLAIVCHTRVVPHPEIVPYWQQLGRHISRVTFEGVPRTCTYCTPGNRPQVNFIVTWNVQGHVPGVQGSNCSGAHPTSYPMGTAGYFPGGYSNRGIKLTTHLQLVPRSSISGFVSPLPYACLWRSA
jgi:hypothetical protein